MFCPTYYGAMQALSKPRERNKMKVTVRAYLGGTHGDLLGGIYLNGPTVLGERRLLASNGVGAPEQFDPRPLRGLDEKVGGRDTVSTTTTSRRQEGTLKVIPSSESGLGGGGKGVRSGRPAGATPR